MRIKGFSLVEAMIALFIVCLMTTLGAMKFQDMKQRIAFDNSILEFKMALEQAGRVATITNEKVEIHYYSKSNCLQIDGKNFEKEVLLDKSIWSATIVNYQIYGNGAFGPKKITFTDGRRKRNLKIQMSWGRIICEE